MTSWTPRKIKNFRKRYKLSRRALGEYLGVSKEAIYYWERDQRVPSLTALILLSRIQEDFRNECGF
jgi:DNA-binding transcriptional regulator YiaG